MISRRLLLALITLTSVLLPFAVVGEEVLRLPSGREVPLRDGTLRFEDARALLQEAEAWFKKGHLGLAYDHCQALLTKGDVTMASEATALIARIEEVERSSLVILRNGKTFRGKLRAELRSDHLGIQQRQQIPLWKLERLEAEYFISYSQVTQTYYVLTLLDVQFRHAPPARTRITEEFVLEVEGDDGTVRRAMVGYPYVLLRKEEMGEQFPQMIRDRVTKVLVYPALHNGEVSRLRGER